jgi:hypothetical protein
LLGQLSRRALNTVGKHGQLGGSIRCVVSASMLTEGWDANTVTHVLGIRAFGTQLLCEQVIGRALRRQSYTENEEGLFDVEYADVFGVRTWRGGLYFGNAPRRRRPHSILEYPGRRLATILLPNSVARGSIG